MLGWKTGFQTRYRRSRRGTVRRSVLRSVRPSSKNKNPVEDASSRPDGLVVIAITLHWIELLKWAEKKTNRQMKRIETDWAGTWHSSPEHSVSGSLCFKAGEHDVWHARSVWEHAASALSSLLVTSVLFWLLLTLSLLHAFFFRSFVSFSRFAMVLVATDDSGLFFHAFEKGTNWLISFLGSCMNDRWWYGDMDSNNEWWTIMNSDWWWGIMNDGWLKHNEGWWYMYNLYMLDHDWWWLLDWND